ncbi:NlpC/P60 family protein [Georgenia sp. TF02-10]|nr:NlpC/P60 family protein [Georgenia sp. TF02-10]
MAGKDRYATAAAVAGAFPRGGDAAYLASAQNFPDALAAAAAAGSAAAPVLLTPTGSPTLPAATAAALDRSRPGQVTVVGGTAAVPDAVVTEASAVASGQDPVEAHKPGPTPPAGGNVIGQIGAGYTAPAASGAGAAALAWARTQLGVPYQWGGTGNPGYDCSGLTQKAYAHAGVTLPRTTKQQWDATKRVAIKDLAPGDLVFWSSNGQPSGIYHVAIYAGNDQRLHAPYAGKNVELVPMYKVNMLPYGGRAG